MRSELDVTVLKRIFSDCEIVDIDLSNWWASVTVLAVSDHYEQWEGRCPVLCITFQSADRFNLRFNNRIDSENNLQMKWISYKCTISEIDTTTGGGFKIFISGSPHMPSIECECRNIAWEVVPTSVLDRVFPGWQLPTTGFVRQDIKSILKESGQ